MMKVEWLHHTGFNVSDMDQSLEFYRDLLGLEVTRDLVFEGEILDKLGGLPDYKAHIVFWVMEMIGTSLNWLNG